VSILYVIGLMIAPEGF